MNREIKFRAWDGKKMIHNVAVIGGIAMVEKNPTNSLEIVDECGRRGYTDWAKYEPVENAIIMEFTGLNDKYDGDIIDHEDGEPPLVVAWDVQKARWVVLEINGDYADDLDGNENGKTIGNIHDNPELIGGAE